MWKSFWHILDGIRICFLFFGEEYISRAARATGTGILLCFFLFSFFFLGQNKRTHIQQQKEWQRRKLQVCLWQKLICSPAAGEIQTRCTVLSAGPELSNLQQLMGTFKTSVLDCPSDRRFTASFQKAQSSWQLSQPLTEDSSKRRGEAERKGSREVGWGKNQHTRRELALRAKLRVLGAGEDTAGARDVWFCRAGWRGRYRDPGDEDRRGSGWISGRGEML